MPTVTCKCGQKLKVREDKLGQRILCPTCKKMISLGFWNCLECNARNPDESDSCYQCETVKLTFVEEPTSPKVSSDRDESPQPEKPVIKTSEISTGLRNKKPSSKSITRRQGDFLIALLCVLITLQAIPFFFNTSTPVKQSRTQWEYRIESPSDISFDARMKRFGNEGWELVTARRARDNLLDRMMYEIILKRPKLDRAEKVTREQNKLDQQRISEKIRLTKIFLEQAKADNKQLDSEIEQGELELQKVRQETRDLKKQYPLIFKDEND